MLTSYSWQHSSLSELLSFLVPSSKVHHPLPDLQAEADRKALSAQSGRKTPAGLHHLSVGPPGLVLNGGKGSIMAKCENYECGCHFHHLVYSARLAYFKSYNSYTWIQQDRGCISLSLVTQFMQMMYTYSIEIQWLGKTHFINEELYWRTI